MKFTVRKFLAGLLIASAGLMNACLADVANTKHNLSVSGPGAVKASSESQTCIFCHAPHNNSPTGALWNRRSPGSTYTPYTSSTTKASIGQPTGGSLLCLSCHDGTIALGEVLSRTARIVMSGGVTTLAAGNSNLGTDLSDDHPVSFAYTSALAAARNGELVDPATLTNKVKLDSQGQMQCTSCHDAHDNTNGKFLVMPNTASALCIACHTKSGWSSNSHAISTKTWKGIGTNPWSHTSNTTVASNACESCHRPHSAGGKKSLMNLASEESNCYSCHNGNVAALNVQSEFSKTSAHPVGTNTGVHTAGETNISATRHVECADCHNSHGSTSAAGSGVTIPGSLAKLRGVTIAGTDINPITAEYQLCFRCHGDSTGKPAQLATRQFNPGNTRLQFQTTNASFHPIAGVGKNTTTVPSLLTGWTATSLMKCGDCHNNNSGTNNSGTGPKGAHGSTYKPLLERNYVYTATSSYVSANYTLCWKCHSETIVRTTSKSFQRHDNTHIRYGCTACHDPHGVATQAHLVNFDTKQATAVSGVLSYTSTGTRAGSCTVACHGHTHRAQTYK